MLGWGEITLTRYVNKNFTPNKANSDKLRSIKDPYVFKHIIDEKRRENDEKLIKDNAFQRLVDRVIIRFDEVEREEGKIYQIINWFLSQSSDENRMTHLALQKLLYFAQGWNYAINGKSLFNDEKELSNEIISKELIKEYYLDIAQKYDISCENTTNIRKYLNDLLGSRK